MSHILGDSCIFTGVVVEIVDIRAHEQRQDGGDNTVEEDLGCDQACALRGGGPVIRELVTPHGAAHPVGFVLVGPDGHKNPSIDN